MMAAAVTEEVVMVEGTAAVVTEEVKEVAVTAVAVRAVAMVVVTAAETAVARAADSVAAVMAVAMERDEREGERREEEEGCGAHRKYCESSCDCEAQALCGQEEKSRQAKRIGGRGVNRQGLGPTGTWNDRDFEATRLLTGGRRASESCARGQSPSAAPGPATS